MTGGSFEFFQELDEQATGGKTNGRTATPPRENIRFQFSPFRDIKLSTAPPYIVRGMIPRLGVVVVWGKPKCGKTFWVFDLEMHVALGWPYWGRRVEQGAVLHIACEAVSGIGARKEAWRVAHSEGKDADAVDLINAAPFYLCKDTALNLIEDVDTVIADISAQFGGRPIKIITIDTLNRSLKGSESKDDDMAAYVRAATLLAEQFQCVVIIIHHCGHNEARPRGHSSLLGAVDALIEAKKDAEGRVCTEVEEMRDGPVGASTASRLDVIEVGRDDNGDLITSCVILADEESTTRQAVKPKGRRLTPSQTMALRFLGEAVNAAGTAPAPGSKAPTHSRVTTPDLWRRYYLAGTVSDNPKADTRRASLRRARIDLQALGVIGIWNEEVWIN